MRLDESSKRKLDELAKATGLSRSEIVRNAIRFYDPGPTPEATRTVFEHLENVIGIANIGGRRARDSERILREAFAKKRRTS